MEPRERDRIPGGAGDGGRRLGGALILVAIGLAFAAGLVLEPRETDGEWTLRLGPLRVPDTCWFRAGTGIPCASCGITRSIVLLLHGRVRDSWRSHPFGWLVVALALLQVPPRAAVAAGREGGWVRRWDRAWAWSVAVALAALLAWWALGLALTWHASGRLG